MPLVLKEDGVAVHIYPIDDGKTIHCFDGDIALEIEIEIDLDTGLIAGYGPGTRLPTEDFQWRALSVFRRNRNRILQAWDEINE